MAYKQDQGRYARLAAYWTLALLLFYGCMSLREALSAFQPLSRPLVASMPKIPILGLNFDAGLLIVAVVLFGGMYLLYRFLERPKSADLLIDTESELRKVTWPSGGEAVNSSIVVIGTVLFLMAFLAGADWILGKWTMYLLTGSA
jgi:preprotein translocase SecE subunit